jgi:PAS domain S-box-containing protein
MDLPYRQYFDTLPCYVSVEDRDFRIIAANQRFEEAFGDWQGRRCYQVYKQRPEPCEVCPVARTFHDGNRHSGEERLICLDGTELSVLVYTEPIRNESGDIAAVMEMSTDITDIKRLQQQLRESQARYRTLFEEVPCYISIQDQELNIVDANRLYRRDFGDFLGCKCWQVYKHRTEECFPCCVRSTFADGRSRVNEEVVTSNRGETMNVLVHTAPILDSAGEIKYIMEMSTNITEIRRLESKLASLGLLIGSISHGIKGLLNGLNGGIYLVTKGLENNNTSRLHQGWEIVLRNVARIRSMVLDILYYAKDRELDRQQVSSAEIIREVCDLMSGRARELHVDLNVEIDDETGLFEGDAKAVRSMLMNLVENALDACRVDARKNEHQVKLRLVHYEDEVEFVVADNGIGMERETREKAFTLFFSSKGSEGTGLGLFIANKIADAHGGAIRIESEIERGTSFTIRIPRTSHFRESVAPDRQN